MNIFFARIGVGDFKYNELMHLLLNKYQPDTAIGTTEWDSVVEEFQEERIKIIDLRELKNKLFSRKETCSNFKAVDSELLKKMAVYEEEILQVILRVSRRFQDSNAKKEFYCNCLRYWNGILDEYRINLYVGESMPHEVNEMIVYFLCKIKGIRTLTIQDTPIEGYSFITEDIYNLLPEIENSFKNKRHIDNEKINLNPDFSNILRRYMDRNEDITPKYVTNDNLILKKEFQEYKVSIIRRTCFSIILLFQIIINTKNDMLIRFIINQLMVRDYLNTWGEAISYYDKNIIDFNKNKEHYIYVPLHVQPEASTLPLAGRYNDQLLYIKMLSFCLPEGYFLYVKEHPGQYEINSAYPVFRDVNFYKALTAIKNVRLISTKVDTYELIENSIAVATATGTVGFEAIFRDKQVIMFGHRIFEYAPGVYKIHSIDECKKAMDEIVNSWKSYKTNRYEMEKWLLALQEVVFYNHHHKNFKICKSDNSEDKRYIFDALCEKIDEKLIDRINA